jgi:hypothetical protein
LLRNAATRRHKLNMMAGNTSRPNSRNVGIAQGKGPHIASVGRGAAPSATQAQKVRHIKQRRAKRHKTAIASVPSALAASWAAVRFSRTGPKILVGTECSGLESVMAAFDNMDLGDRAQLEFICEKDTAARNLVLAHRQAKVVCLMISLPVKSKICLSATSTRQGFRANLGQPQGSARALMTGKVVDICSSTFTSTSAARPHSVSSWKIRQGLDHGHTPGRFRGVFGVPTGWVGQQVHGLLARAQHS